ncbi:hypothetical protein BDR03DRAFT_1018477 [Suillus americanus]|nr:hypothetical protein BDR03DRAFT_1018477 [Suillus americanus]
MRWAEEVELLQEERTLGTAANIEGLGAYAYHQAQLRDDLTNCFENNTTYPVDSASKTVMANEAELDLYLLKLPLP